MKLRGALVGFGFIGEGGHFPGYRDGRTPFQIDAIVDISPARRALACAMAPGVRVYEDHRQMLAAEKGRLDFVDIATPPCDHAAIAHDALDAGLHILVEKPITTTLNEAEELLRHARAAGRVVFPCHNYKHAPVVREVRRALDEDRIGDVHLVTLQTFRPTHAKGVRDWRPDWRRDRATSGGGIAMDHGSHTLYLTFDWLGAYPDSVTAFSSTTPGATTEDNFSCSLRFPNGAIATAYLTWTAGMRRVIYTLHGSRGALRVEDDDIETVLRVHGEKEPPTGLWSSTHANASSSWMDASHVGWFRSVLDLFASAIERGDHVPEDMVDALHCIATIEGGYRSVAERSREVDLSRIAWRDTSRRAS
jgi:predicted dehydrogenase